LSEA
jgi:hypothetical protein